MMQVGRSGAKFILSGEHSIIHGGCALSFPVSSLFLEYEETTNSNESGVLLNNQKLEVSYYEKILKLRELFEFPQELPLISIKSTIPMGSGLGSSAALCHAMLNAKGISDLQKKLDLCHRGEKILHGRSSGVDPYTVVLNRPLCFYQDLKYEILSTQAWTQSKLQFVLIDSQAKHSTSEAIAQQQNLKEANLKLWENCISKLQNLSLKMKVAFQSDPTHCPTLMNEIHNELNILGVSHSEIEKTRSILNNAGALASKLTGAGRGGFVLAVFEQSTLEKIDLQQFFPQQNIIYYSLPS